MLFSHNLLVLVRINLSFLHAFSPYPYKFKNASCKRNRKSNQIETKSKTMHPQSNKFDKKSDRDKSNILTFSSQAGQQRENLKILIQLGIAILVAAQLIRFKNKFPTGLVYEGWLYVVVPFTMSITVLVYFKKNKSVVEFFNTLVTFELNLMTGNLQLLHAPGKYFLLALKAFQFLAIIGTPIISFSLTMRQLTQKCLPFSPGFELLEECAEMIGCEQKFLLSGLIANVYWFLVCLLFYWSFLKMSGGFFFFAVQCYIVESCCIRYYLNNIWENVLHQNTNMNALSMIQIYKQLQLLVCYFNNIHQDIFAINMLSLVGLSMIIGLYAIITSWSVMTSIQFFVLSAAASRAFVGLMLCYGNFGGIYNDSLQFIALVKKPQKPLKREMRTLHKMRFQSKLAQCLQPLKIKIGSVNYVDKLTPIMFVDFCFGILVNMLLLK